MLKKLKKSWNSFTQRMLNPPKWMDLDSDVQNLKDEYKLLKETKSPNSILQNNKIWWFLRMALFMVIVWFLIFWYVETIVLVLGSYLISMIAEWPIQMLRNTKLSKWLSISIVYLFIILFLIFSILFMFPLILSQISWFTTDLANMLVNMQGSLSNMLSAESIRQIARLPEFLQDNMIHFLQTSDSTTIQRLQSILWNIISESRQFVTFVWSFLITALSSIIWLLWEFIIVITLSIMFSVEKDQSIEFISELSWKKLYKTTKLKLQIIYKNLSLRVKHRFILSLFMFISMYATFWILSLFGIDVPYKFELSLALWILDIIPYLWPIFAWALMFVVALWEYSFWVALVVPILVSAINIIENAYIIPMLMNKSLWVSLVLTFIVMVIWLATMWIFGAFLSMPLAVVLATLYQTSIKNINNIDVNRYKDLN